MTLYKRGTLALIRVAIGGRRQSELGPAHVRINSTRRVTDSEIVIDATLIQPGSVNFRADSVAVVIRESRHGWRIASWNVHRVIPPR